MLQNKKNVLGFLLLLAACAGMTKSHPAHAAEATDAPSQQAQSDAGDHWVLYGQGTYVDQFHPSFTAPYSGANSLDPRNSNNETADLTLFAGHQLWNGAEFWINPEIDQGFGLSNTLGIAGFPSGEAYKIGANTPYLRIPRAFVREVINLSSEVKQQDAAVNQLAGAQSSNNLTLTVGKFSVVDIFDTNTYAHDPRSDFLNWAVIDSGSFDYAADSWGFTNGIAAEWNQNNWTLRGGVFQLSSIPNSKVSGIDFHQFEAVSEVEERHQWLSHPGKFKVLVFVNRGDMGSYDDALQLAHLTDAIPITALVRRYRSDPGVTLNFEQGITAGLGLFARAGSNSGEKEAYEFSDISRSISAGLSLQGTSWGRAGDKAGVAAVANALSSSAQTYFAAGGLGILIGDGQLNYAPEKIAETYYSMQLTKRVKLTADYQRVINPGYNQDRGPVSFYALRLHAEM